MTEEESTATGQSPDVAPYHAGMVAVVGRANVGKSSLVNAILGEKVSIVSSVPQTTRNAIRGILTKPCGQIVFIDTPGIHKAQNDLGKLMNRMARASIEGCDAILLVLDASVAPQQEDIGWMTRLGREEANITFALNKKDSGEAFAAAYRDAWKDSPQPATWLPVSAKSGEGVSELVEHLYRQLPESPALFPHDVLTDYPRKLNIADVIREKLFGVLRDEIPHAVAVWVEEIVESEDGWDIVAFVYVNRSSQKGIVIGDRGRVLRKVRRSAEAELMEMYGKAMRLDLWVKVEPNWTRNFWLLKKFGYAP